MGPRSNHLRKGVNGLERWCTSCKAWKPVKEFNRRVKQLQEGPPRAWFWFHLCRDCRANNYDRVAHGTVSGLIPLTEIWWIFDEIVQRLGMTKGAEAIGFSYDNLRRILYRQSRSVQKRHVRSAIMVLRELRDDDVWAAPTIGRPRKYRRETA